MRSSFLMALALGVVSVDGVNSAMVKEQRQVIPPSMPEDLPSSILRPTGGLGAAPTSALAVAGPTQALEPSIPDSFLDTSTAASDSSESVVPSIPVTSSTSPILDEKVGDKSDPINGASRAGGSKTNTGAIVGGVVGGIAVLALMTLAIFWFVLRRRPKDKRFSNDRTESALALEKLGSDSPESPSDTMPSMYPAPIDTAHPLPPPPPPPPVAPKPVPVVDEHHIPQSQTSQEREQLLPPIPSGAPQRHPSLRKPVPTAPQQHAPTPAPIPPPPPVEPAEILSREIDSDGVSVRSFDMEQEAKERAANAQAVPRLPIYTKPSSSGDNLGLPGQAM